MRCLQTYVDDSMCFNMRLLFGSKVFFSEYNFSEVFFRNGFGLTDTFGTSESEDFTEPWFSNMVFKEWVEE